MDPSSQIRCALLTVGVVGAAACGTADPVAPPLEGAPALAGSAYITAAAAPEVSTWELSGLLWGRAPGMAGGPESVALRSTLPIASRDHEPPASTIRLRLPPGRSVGELGTISYRFLFAAGDCGGGSPRIQVGLDLDGDGDFDANAFGYAGPAASGFTGCGTGTWLEEVATDGDRPGTSRVSGWAAPMWCRGSPGDLK